MMRKSAVMRLVVMAALAAASLAGCADALGPGSYTLTAEGIPSEVARNATFNFTLHVDAARDDVSDHIGADYWANSTDDPTADRLGRLGACTHVPDEQAVPGSFDITCTIVDEGPLYLRGHMRIVDGDASFHYWSNEHVVRVV